MMSEDELVDIIYGKMAAMLLTSQSDLRVYACAQGAGKQPT